MWKSTVRLASELGVTRQTTFKWARDGKFERVQKTKGGHYRIWVEPEAEEFTVVYCRVSSAKQSSSLDTQEAILTKRYPDAEVIRDTGSGFNFKRKGLKALLERCLSGAAIKVVVTTRDRLCRTAFPLLQWLIELHGGSITCLEEGDDPIESFDHKTLLAFLTSFCASHHGKRSGRRKQEDSDLSPE